MQPKDVWFLGRFNDDNVEKYIKTHKEFVCCSKTIVINCNPHKTNINRHQYTSY